jgi:hypothetical protein
MDDDEEFVLLIVYRRGFSMRIPKHKITRRQREFWMFGFPVQRVPPLPIKPFDHIERCVYAEVMTHLSQESNVVLFNQIQSIDMKGVVEIYQIYDWV